MRALNMRTLSNEIEARYPGVVIGGVGDKPHQLQVSDHNEDDTPGSRSAQTDADNVPEHRAIDVMLGPAMSVLQMWTIIDRILADPRLLKRLKYINFLNWQWSASSGWVRHDNSGDPHPDHGHFSGLASNDEDGSPWLTELLGDSDMPKIVHQEGQGWWVVGNGNPEGIPSESALKDLEKAYGPSTTIQDQENYGIGKPPRAILIALSPAQLEAVIAGVIAGLTGGFGNLRRDIETDTRSAMADGLQGGVNALRE